MNTRIIQIRSLDNKTKDLPAKQNIIPFGKSWIGTIREALGMTALQLAKRLGVTQPRIVKMEQNEKNLKISTMEKVAQALNCEFVYYFKPKDTFQNIVEAQAKEKVQSILKSVNLNMALENQNISTDDAVLDMTNDFINNNTKRIWD